MKLPSTKLMFVCLFFALFLGPYENSSRAQIANPSASDNAKAVLRYLKNLKGRSEDRVLLGQDLGHGNDILWGYPHFVTRLEENTMRTPGLIGGDYGLDVNHDVAATNQVFIEHWKRGGLVAISWHIDNPWTDGNSWDTTRQEDLNELIDGQLAAKWIAQLDEIAAALKPLQQQGVPVLFRPLHEVNGDWFWWGRKDFLGHEVAYKRLFRHMHDYLNREHGLDNLIWVYSAAVTYDNGLTDYYPGPEYVDVVGIDIYDDRVRGRDIDPFGNVYPGGYKDHLDDLIELGNLHGHPVGISEFGRTMGLAHDAQYNYKRLINALRGRPEIVFSYSWHDYEYQGYKLHAIASNRGQFGTMHDPLTATLIDIELDYGVDGEMRIRNVASGRCLSTISDQSNRVVNTFGGLDQSAAKTRWTLEGSDKLDEYRLRSAWTRSNQQPNYLHNVARVRARTQTTSSRQVWILERLDHVVRFKSKFDGRYLTDSSGGRVRSEVDQPESALQQWVLEPIE